MKPTLGGILTLALVTSFGLVVDMRMKIRTTACAHRVYYNVVHGTTHSLYRFRNSDTF